MSKNKLPIGSINCENMSTYKNIKIKEYDYNKLNNKIKENLITINDYIIIEDNNNFNYILLCGIKFNKEIFNNININKKIDKTVQDFENKFIKKYSKLYNLIYFNE